MLLNDTRTIKEAEARGALYAAIAAGWRYPDDDGLAALGDFARRLRAADVLGRLDDPTRRALQGVVQWFEDARERDIGELRARHGELFGHVVRGACPLYELEYGQSEIIQQASELADIAGFYGAFGLEPAGPDAERPDHASVECEFMSILCAKEAEGARRKLEGLGDACAHAQRIFLRDHLARWLPALCSRVCKADGESFYDRMARLASAFIESECGRLEIAPGPQFLELRTVDPAVDAAFECDGAESAPPLVPLSVRGGALTTGRRQ